jgi:FMN phosphatase YigB (HAD superfamily)
MAKIKLFIDFDGTIFDTSEFKKEMFDAFFRCGYALPDIKSTYVLESMDYKYNPEGHLEKLQKIKPTNHKLALARIENLYKSVTKYLYPDTMDFLDNIDRGKYEVNMLTLGDIGFQQKKVDRSGIADRFEQVYVTDTQKWDYLENIVSYREEFVLIDDRADTLEKVKAKFHKSLCMQIVRQDLDIDDAAIMYKEVYGGIKIKSLSEAFKYL